MSGDTSTTVYDYYAPADPAGELMTDAAGLADGYTMPGDLDPGAIWQEDLPDGGDASGSTFEARVPWSVLGAAPGAPLSFHVASSNSPNPSNLSGQVDDNLGGLGGSVGTFAFSAVEIGPDNARTLAGGPPVAYAHRITNTGTRTDSFALQVRSSLSRPTRTRMATATAIRTLRPSLRARPSTSRSWLRRWPARATSPT